MGEASTAVYLQMKAMRGESQVHSNFGFGGDDTPHDQKLK